MQVPHAKIQYENLFRLSKDLKIIRVISHRGALLLTTVKLPLLSKALYLRPANSLTPPFVLVMRGRWELTMAKPTSAFFNAGPSLVPSPVTATTSRMVETREFMMPGVKRVVRGLLRNRVLEAVDFRAASASASAKMYLFS